MKNKKSRLALGLGIVGIGGALALSLAIKKELAERKAEKIKATLRQFFDQLGEIAVLYVNETESDTQVTRGGVVMTDGRVYQFSYEKGQIAYEEEKV